MRTSPLRLCLYALAVAAGLLFALPNLLTKEQAKRLPGILPSQQMSLGLDLKGGSHLVLEVDGSALVREQLQEIASQAKDAVQQAGISYSSITPKASSVELNLSDAAQEKRGPAQPSPDTREGGGHGQIPDQV